MEKQPTKQLQLSLQGPSVKLLTKEGQTLSISLDLAFQSGLLKNLLEDRSQSEQESEEEAIPLKNFEEKTIKKVVEFMQHEAEFEKLPEIPRPVPSSRLADAVPIWFAEFIDRETLEDVYEVIAAANYLIVPGLVELGCAKVGSLMKDKTIPEMRQMFHITNDFSPEEERSIIEGKADIWGDEDDEGD